MGHKCCDLTYWRSSNTSTLLEFPQLIPCVGPWMRSTSSREPNQMKKLHSASIGAALLAAISAIRRIASASPLLWPLAMLLYGPAISRLAIVIGSLGARARTWATIILARFRTGKIQRRDAAVVAKASRSFWPLQAGIAGLFSLVAAGLMATTIPLVYA